MNSLKLVFTEDFIIVGNLEYGLSKRESMRAAKQLLENVREITQPTAKSLTAATKTLMTAVEAMNSHKFYSAASYLAKEHNKVAYVVSLWLRHGTAMDRQVLPFAHKWALSRRGVVDVASAVGMLRRAHIGLGTPRSDVEQVKSLINAAMQHLGEWS